MQAHTIPDNYTVVTYDNREKISNRHSRYY